MSKIDAEHGSEGGGRRRDMKQNREDNGRN
jgi:hypothetical protein